MKTLANLVSVIAVAICFVSFDLNAQGAEYDWSGGNSGSDWNTDNWSGGAPYDNAGDTGNLRSGDVAMARGGTEFKGRLNVHTGATLRFDGSPTATNLHMNGGRLRAWNAGGSLQGRIITDADSFLVGESGPRIAAKILGENDLTKTWDVLLSVQWDASEWTGRLIVGKGTLRVHDGALTDTGTHEIIVAAGSEWELWVPPSGGWKIGNSFLGNGHISTIRSDALTLQGSTIRPGDTADGPAVGTLNFRKTEDYNLSLLFDLNGTNRCHIVIDVTGEGGIAGEDYDQLFTDHYGDKTQSINLGTGKTDLTVNFDGKPDLEGQTLTVVKADNGTLTGTFETVTLQPSDWRATVNYNADSVTLTDVHRTVSGTVICIK